MAIRIDQDGDKIRPIKKISLMSYDVKNLPTNINKLGGYIPTSSIAFVIDTGDCYMYSEDNEQWYLL